MKRNKKILLTLLITITVIVFIIVFGPIIYVFSGLSAFQNRQEQILDDLTIEEHIKIAETSKILLDKYKDTELELKKDDPNIPTAVKNINPVYIRIRGKEKYIMIALMGGIDHSGLIFKEDPESNNSNTWILTRYWQHKRKDLIRVEFNDKNEILDFTEL